MSSNKVKTNSYGVGGRHFSTPSKIRGYVQLVKEQITLIVSDQTIQPGGLRDFFQHIDKAAENVGKNCEYSWKNIINCSRYWYKKVSENPVMLLIL